MKSEYVLINRDELMLIQSEIAELEHDLMSILKKKTMVIDDTKKCKIRFDSSFLMSPGSNEIFKISDKKEK